MPFPTWAMTAQPALSPEADPNGILTLCREHFRGAWGKHNVERNSRLWGSYTRWWLTIIRTSNATLALATPSLAQLPPSPGSPLGDVPVTGADTHTWSGSTWSFSRHFKTGDSRPTRSPHPRGHNGEGPALHWPPQSPSGLKNAWVRPATLRSRRRGGTRTEVQQGRCPLVMC
jgi:hypothetical protein